MLQKLYPFAVAFLIGFFIGIERERSHPPGVHAIGIRTFTLLALLGTLAAWTDQAAIIITLSLFAFAAILLGYRDIFVRNKFVRAKATLPRVKTRDGFHKSSKKRQMHHAVGLTTELAAAVVYCLGFMSYREPVLAAIIGSIVLIILFARKQLHHFSRDQLKPNEIEAAIVMLLAMLIVLTFLPNHTVDPWGIFNPRRFGILVLAIAAIQFGGYIAIRLFGHRLGMLMLGFFGGLVSSTVVFATLPGVVRQHPALWRAAVAAAVFSITGMLVEFILILFVASSQLLLTILWPILAVLVVSTFSALLMLHTDVKKHHLVLSRNSPLHIISVIRLSALIGGMLILVAIAKQYLGTEGMQIVAFLGGLFELHSITLATAILYVGGKFSTEIADTTLAIALLASFVSKFILLWGLARNRFAVVTSGFLIAMLLVGTVTFFFTR